MRSLHVIRIFGFAESIHITPQRANSPHRERLWISTAPDRVPHSRNRVSQFAPQLKSPMAADHESKGIGMTQQPEPDNAAAEREEINAYVARFKATQERFKREREE